MGSLISFDNPHSKDKAGNLRLGLSRMSTNPMKTPEPAMHFKRPARIVCVSKSDVSCSSVPESPLLSKHGLIIIKYHQFDIISWKPAGLRSEAKAEVLQTGIPSTDHQLYRSL